MKKFQSTCQNCTNKFCTKLSTEVREEIFKNRIWFNLNAKEEQLFYFNNKQILIIESGSFMRSYFNPAIDRCFRLSGFKNYF